MHVERLRLSDFRNYHELDLSLPAGLIVVRGRNAQGKSNLLEALSMIATSRSFRTSSERETVRWGSLGHFARIDATVARRSDTLHVEMVVSDTGLVAPAGRDAHQTATSVPPPTPPAAPFRKRIRVNGTPRRAMDLVGQVTVVTFAPTDLDLVTGSPSARRHFLDVTLCQVRASYCRTLTQYQKVLVQRSALLRRIREGEESPHALAYWDDQLAQLAVPLMRERAALIARAEETTARVYAALSREELADDDDGIDGFESTPNELPPLRLVYRSSYDGPLAGPDVSEASLVADFKERLVKLRRREIAQGANVLGPHRDDLAFLSGDVDLATYGSRGQQRSVALALKLAELEYIEAETGDQPILLLDDVMSELDSQRRDDLLDAVRDLDQVFLTVTDATTLPPAAIERAHLYTVRAGQVIPEAVA